MKHQYEIKVHFRSTERENGVLCTTKNRLYLPLLITDLPGHVTCLYCISKLKRQGLLKDE